MTETQLQARIRRETRRNPALLDFARKFEALHSSRSDLNEITMYGATVGELLWDLDCAIVSGNTGAAEDLRNRLDYHSRFGV